ncbi:hypothetical protein L227DRAFT_566346 [Lentinus tigrinus ALCF2SS1-6]|uniref:Uncharacterized protein n=1 Tax=Lentinus tigrinus ALCF2SS1-6 TaxID=1328759 RepID=A0A5C2RYA4_9APHY|nr:hypothetical protein L227DRAFT_566346 [Lentinus tigrinus ALCF2SS1-6]
MAATARAFTIFRDEPEAPVVENKPEHGPTTTITVPPSGPLLVYGPDKENLDPLTGSRALSEHALGKKRKTTLAVKTQPVSPSKKPRPLSEKSMKKASSSSNKPRLTEKKAKRPTSSKRSSTRPRREPSLPRLVEEREEVETLDQIAIDAKCKELTVLPLADISEAYEQAASPEELVARAEKEAEEKAYVSDEKVERPSTPVQSPPKADMASPAPPATGSVFSTPERKRIYSAFTFSTPSPASERYASARGSSVERFSDVVF